MEDSQSVQKVLVGAGHMVDIAWKFLQPTPLYIVKYPAQSSITFLSYVDILEGKRKGLYLSHIDYGDSLLAYHRLT